MVGVRRGEIGFSSRVAIAMLLTLLVSALEMMWKFEDSSNHRTLKNKR